MNVEFHMPHSSHQLPGNGRYSCTSQHVVCHGTPFFVTGNSSTLVRAWELRWLLWVYTSNVYFEETNWYLRLVWSYVRMTACFVLCRYYLCKRVASTTIFIWKVAVPSSCVVFRSKENILKGWKLSILCPGILSVMPHCWKNMGVFLPS